MVVQQLALLPKMRGSTKTSYRLRSSPSCWTRSPAALPSSGTRVVGKILASIKFAFHVLQVSAHPRPMPFGSPEPEVGARDSYYMQKPLR